MSIVEHSSRRGQKLVNTASTVIGFGQSPRKTPRSVAGGGFVSPRDYHVRKRAQSLLAVDVTHVSAWKDGEAEPASPCSDARSTTSGTGHRTTTGAGRPPPPLPPAPPAALADVEPSEVVVTSAADSAHSIVPGAPEEAAAAPPGAPEAAPAALCREGRELEV